MLIKKNPLIPPLENADFKCNFGFQNIWKLHVLAFLPTLWLSALI